MRCSAALLFGAYLTGAAGCSDPAAGRIAAHRPELAASAPPQRARELRRQPKPGERVPQPELDGYCTEAERTAAYYYHGGSPVVRVAREDGCAPLYIGECEVAGQCDAPRDQEPGMWCCAPADHQQTAAHALR
jgi:hypothetical protein